jgi:hypothetical protein
MRYRKLTYDPVTQLYDFTFGQGVASYLLDIDAVAQAIRTKILLFLGEWWEDQEDGLPMWQKILGVMGARKEIIDGLITKRTLETPNVTSIASWSSILDSANRSYSFQGVVNTAYGQVTITMG